MLSGVGSYLPEKILGNEELARNLFLEGEAVRAALKLEANDSRLEQFKTSDEWIRKHSRVKERRIVGLGEATSDMAARAGRAALAAAKLEAGEVECLVVARVSPDFRFSPPVAALVHRALELPRRIFAFDVENACSSFASALAAGYAFIKSGMADNALVVGADAMSTAVSKQSRYFWPIMGDGAGAFVLRRAEEDWFGPQNFDGGYQSFDAELIIAPAGGSRRPLVPADLADPFVEPHMLTMQGNAVSRRVMRLLPGVIEDALRKAGVPLGEVGCIIAHQMNGVLLENVSEELRKRGFRGAMPITIDRFGNTTSASIPLGYEDAFKRGIIQPGMLVLLVAVGGGLGWCTALMRIPK